MIKSFEYYSTPNCVALILGTMPGNESLLQNKYYAHPDNIFWDIVIRIFKPEINELEIESLNYEERIQVLLNNKIALWDVLKYCDREDALDSSIRNEIKNDFEDFFKKHNEIKTIFFNGQPAKKYFEKEFIKLMEGLKIKLIVLPSTSPSNRLNCFQKLNQWRVIKLI